MEQTATRGNARAADAPRARRWSLGQGLRRDTLADLAREHGVALALYSVLSLALTWPLVRHFATQYIGHDQEAMHNIWVFWHFWQWAQGKADLFYSDLIYFPHGISLLVHGVGPAVAALSLPFWPLGPVAAFNGAMLSGMTLTGYAMYRLARAMNFDRSLALLAGVLLISSSQSLVGLLVAHPEQLFLAPFIFTLLALHHALDPQRHWGWALGIAAALLVTLLTNGYLFLFAVATVALFWAIAWLRARSGARGTLARRAALLVVGCLVLVVPLLLQVRSVAADPQYRVNGKDDAYFTLYRPDALHFLLPSNYSRLFGTLSERLGARLAPGLHMGAEPSVFIPWVALPLALLAFKGHRVGWRWGTFTVGCIVLALGPSLSLLGRTTFTYYNLPIVLPYALLTDLPGLDFVRVPSRWMMVGFVGVALISANGAAWLVDRFPRHRVPLLVGVAALWLLPMWPRSWPHAPLPTVPAFYQQLAQDPERYGVLDLPLNTRPDFYVDYAFAETIVPYQMFQMVHGKGIHSGYLSRFYNHHPLPFDLASASVVRVNGDVGWPQGALLADMAQRGYRYVVWHKTVNPGSSGQLGAYSVVRQMFQGQTPVMEDATVAVYQVAPGGTPSDATTLRLGDNWLATPFPPRAASPATLRVTSPREQPATLRFVPGHMHNPQFFPNAPAITTGDLLVQVNNSAPITVSIASDQVFAVPLLLPAGESAIRLTLAAGNVASPDSEPYALELRHIDLQTGEQGGDWGSALVNGRHPSSDGSLVAFFGTGWHDYEADRKVRWARRDAELLVYSTQAQAVRLRLRPQAMYDPRIWNGFGERGMLSVRVNDQAHTFALQRGRELQMPLSLRPGWNTITLSTVAGEFRPSQYPGDNHDARLLGFSTQFVDFIVP